jgi:hypothetical protein
MKTNTILALQSLLVFLQITSAGFGSAQHIPFYVGILLAAGIGSLQVYLQHVGNQTQPDKTSQ